MKEQLEKLKADAIAALSSANDLTALEAVRIRFLGKKGS
jgi:hypothetical protein